MLLKLLWKEKTTLASAVTQNTPDKHPLLMRRAEYSEKHSEAFY